MSLPPESAPRLFEPGQIVTAPSRPDWGEGQVQSALGWRVTVAFREAGRQVVDLRHVALSVKYGV